MKLSKTGFEATDGNGATYYGNCPQWAEHCRRANLRVEPVMVLRKPGPCPGPGCTGQH